MPSVGLEFITQMGVHLPDFLVAGLEMHTNLHHEASFNAKVTMNNNQLKLSIPAPKTNAAFSFRYALNLLQVITNMFKEQWHGYNLHPRHMYMLLMI